MKKYFCLIASIVIGAISLSSCKAQDNDSLPSFEKSIYDTCKLEEGNCWGNCFWRYDRSTKTLTIEPAKEYTLERPYSAYMDRIENVVIEKGVKEIPDSAFEEFLNLKKLTLNEGLTTIGDFAFLGCDKLRSVNFPESLEEIGSRAFTFGTPFVNTSVSEYEMIHCNDFIFQKKDDGFYLFGYIGSDLEILLPNEFKYNGKTISEYKIDSYAFYNNYDLKKVIIPASCKEIGYSAFEGCESLSSIILSEGFESISSYAFYGCNSLSSITIPTSIESISYTSFSGCKKLEEVTILSDAVPSLDYFPVCQRLYLSDTVSNISKESKEPISMDIYTSSEYVKELFKDDERVIVHDKTSNERSIFNVGDYVFQMTSSGLYLIGYSGNDTDLVLPDEITYNGNIIHEYSITNNAFEGLGFIKSVTIPSSVKKIDKGSFDSCRGIEWFKLLGDVLQYVPDEVEEEMVEELSTLKKGYYYETSKDKHKFIGVEGQPTVFYILYSNHGWGLLSPRPHAFFYRELENPINYDDYFVDEGDFTFAYFNEKAYLYKYQGNDEVVTLPDSFTFKGKVIDKYEIYNSAFSNKNMQRLILSNSVTKIGSGAFFDCNYLLSVTIPRSVKEIDDNAFAYCENLVEFRITNSLKNLDFSVISDTKVKSISYLGSKKEASAIFEEIKKYYEDRIANEDSYFKYTLEKIECTDGILEFPKPEYKEETN